MVMPILLGFLLIPMITDAYGHGGHSHGNGGGGCSSCTPPTLGVDSSGKRLVSGGISINEQVYDVEFFKQDLETHTIKVGIPVEITLKIFDEGGYNSLKHVELGLGYDEKFISGVMVPYNHVSIEWDKTFDGKTDIKYNDPHDLLRDISVDVVDNSPVTGVKFKFTPTTVFDSNTIVTKIWDTKRNSNTNYFHNAFEITSNESILLVDAIQNVSKLEYEEEQVSQDAHIVNQVNYDVQCMSGQERLLRVSNKSPVCVDAYQSEVLISNNWAIPTR